MVLSTSFHEDDPRKVYKSKKLKATVQTKTFRKVQTGIIKSDPDGKTISDLQFGPTASSGNSTFRSHTGHGRYQIASSSGSGGSHTIDPSYYTEDVREDRSNYETSRSAPAYSREKSEPISAYSRKQSEPEEAVGSSVSARIAAYRKNAKIVSSPKVSLYSVAANSDRYVLSPMAPVAPGTPVVEVPPVVATRRLSSGRTPKVLETEPTAEEPLPSKLQTVSSPLKDEGIVAEPKSNSRNKSGKSNKKSEGSNKSEESRSIPSKEEEPFDQGVEDAVAQSQQYWASLKKRQQKIKRIQRAEERFMACGAWEDDSTVDSTNTDESSTASWNLLDAILLVGQKDQDSSEPQEESEEVRQQSEEVGLVSKQQLLCDFQESGVDKIKELHQYLKNLTPVDGSSDLVGRDIIATINDDVSSKSSYSDGENAKEGLFARFSALLARMELKSDEEETGRKTTVHTVRYRHRRESNQKKMRHATAQYLAAVAASNSSVTSSERIAKALKAMEHDLSRAANSNEPRVVVPAVSAKKSKGSRGASPAWSSKGPTRSTKKSKPKAASPAPSGRSTKSKKEPRGASPARQADPVEEENKIMNTPSTTVDGVSTVSTSGMAADAGSAVSIKSVRFSEKVETHEPEEVQTPDVPSLMDDQEVEDDEVSSVETPESVDPVAVVEEESDTDDEPRKMKTFFKKLMRRAKRKSKKKVHSKPFHPTLEPMDEEEEVEREGNNNAVRNVYAAGAESASTNTTSDTASSYSTHHYEVPRDMPLPASEGFELIAGCTKTGKKAIMIAKAKNNEQRKRRSEEPARQASLDPPPSTTTTTATNDKKDAASVVANAHQGNTTRANEEEEAKLKESSIIRGANEEKRMESEEEKPTSLDDTAAKKNEILSWMFSQSDNNKSSSSGGGTMDEYVNNALNIIQQHAVKHGVSEQELMDRVAAENRRGGGRGENESVASHDEETFMSDSRYDNTVATKLLTMFDNIFSADGKAAEGEEEASVETSDS